MGTKLTMSKPKRVAIMLELDWSYKHHAKIFAGTQQYGQERGWHSIMDEYVAETLSQSRPRSIPYDGIIARATPKLAQCAARLKVPLVNVWKNSPVSNSVPNVFPDFAALGRLHAEHLMSRGFARFAALTDKSERDVYNSFVSRLGESGYSCLKTNLPTLTAPFKNWQKIVDAIMNAMNSWKLPIGVYVAFERMGRLLAQMCHNRGWRVPEDVAIITGYNEESFCEALHPTLSSVEAGYDHVGYEAAKLLDRMMSGEAPPTQPVYILPKGLVVRESTDFFAVEDELVAASLKFIAENCHKPLSRDDVAHAMSVGPKTLQLRFKKYLNRPVSTEIRRVRIERAKRELSKGKRPLSEIARAVGFGEAMRMYEVFRRELGVTPSQYRRERQTDRTT